MWLKNQIKKKQLLFNGIKDQSKNRRRHNKWPDYERIKKFSDQINEIKKKNRIHKAGPKPRNQKCTLWK